MAPPRKLLSQTALRFLAGGKKPFDAVVVEIARVVEPGRGFREAERLRLRKVREDFDIRSINGQQKPRTKPMSKFEVQEIGARTLAKRTVSALARTGAVIVLTENGEKYVQAVDRVPRTFNPQEVHDLRAKGLSFREVAETLGISAERAQRASRATLCECGCGGFTADERARFRRECRDRLRKEGVLDQYERAR